MDGSLYHLRFGFPPNHFHYCGPRDSRAILDYLKAGKTDEGLRQLLEKFRGAVPYLKFIAQENKIKDPFDRRVVEAYWVGNDLLKNCNLQRFYNELENRFHTLVSKKTLVEMLGNVPLGSRPHHSFHVIHIFSQTGGMLKMFQPSLTLMNNCLIRPGKIKLKIKNKELKIKTQKLKIVNHSIKFVPSIETARVLDSTKFKKGDLVAIHWGWICDKISSSQQIQLNFWNNQSLKLFS
ncbi:hypothetical protein CO101_02665 [Candidatus Berkelbacteria bacterium CG_4_9_14_3_um_filter_39_23]|uniref:Uncharacterized protein n=2 Tax=Candidatus Berkelbacteria TaxID=1618330 RepID=A0A2M7CIC6_9BACT|nr:MAG: hypothetical protein AUK14_03100 [Candidatus Berkelbacteria bacterium CG2_30_39_44]PIR27729.1 MAG: hypothetical protein COV39_02965 [Candidatus Berkelbacteria bacterium CG11_big_fil_rev_8_21_14_0_20_40_23]PIV25394.1 MAG: hypothetical protein COS38_01830 [Candidatus Berkelbacteria bacterium CG03_land_8_20_14_0_80_40_36]PIX30830.1 MAG: hypothetical protein COZ62_00575 [Candidatus Berkelbacteria bacterium CG_4_8_14_3_um_filter_39_27]PIZ28721.1 MAG: hypothetical protein COY44_02660 [Candida